MAAERIITLDDLTTPRLDSVGSSIAPPAIAANNFEIKPALTQLIKADQFAGLEEEDPNQHLHNFLQICGTLKMNNVSDDAIRLRLFEFSLKGEAKLWLQSFPQGYFTTWETLVTSFLAQYFPPDKYNFYRNAIACFTQRDGEVISEAWRRFKGLLMKCTHHGFSDLEQIHIFYNGLQGQIRALVDASAGGSLRKKSAVEARTIIETMASNRYDTPSDFYSGRRQKTSDVSQMETILAQNKILSQQMESLTKQLKQSQINSIHTQPATQTAPQTIPHHIPQPMTQPEYFEQPQTEWESSDPEQLNFLHNNTYNPNRNHPNLSYKSNNYLNYQPTQPRPSYQNQHPPQNNHSQQPTYHNRPPFPQNNNFQNKPPPYRPPHYQDQSSSSSEPQSNQSLEAMLMKFMNESRTSIKNLEHQIGQISKKVNDREEGSLGGDTIVNPKEHCKAITTRSGLTLGNEKEKEKKEEKMEVVVEKEIKTEKEEEKNKEKEEKEEKNKNEKRVEKESEEEREKKKGKKTRNDEQNEDSLKILQKTLPFPQKLVKQKDEHQFKKFMEILKSLKINIPFSEALLKMPSYAKFMKDLLSNKRKFREDETISMTEECSAIIQRKLPQKQKDTGPFTIPCLIENTPIGKALIDLGASVNLMPLSIFKKLKMVDLQPTRMSLQLADRSLKKPCGVIEDVLVRVDKFVFPADFVVLDIEADSEIPIILGRPFLSTGRALIDVSQGEFVLRVGEEKVTFNIFESMKFPSEVMYLDSDF